MNSHIENTYEQAVPLWDEAVKKQTVKKILHTIRTEAKVSKLELCLSVLAGTKFQPSSQVSLQTKSKLAGKQNVVPSIQISKHLSHNVQLLMLVFNI
jgi:hypothetical protein